MLGQLSFSGNIYKERPLWGLRTVLVCISYAYFYKWILFMTEYIEFARSHPLLVFGFIGVLGFIIWSEFGRLNRKYQQLGVTEAVRLLNNDNVFFLDVREDKELDNGIIKGATHIPVSELNSRLSQLEKHKNNPVLIYCRSGSRSAHACNMLTKHGFEDVANLSGGIIAWEAANLPLSKK